MLQPLGLGQILLLMGETEARVGCGMSALLHLCWCFFFSENTGGGKELIVEAGQGTACVLASSSLFLHSVQKNHPRAGRQGCLPARAAVCESFGL